MSASRVCAVAAEHERRSAAKAATIIFIRPWYCPMASLAQTFSQPARLHRVLSGSRAREEEIAMADILHDPRLADRELSDHLRSFHSFSKLVLFAILHIVLVLACLALAF